MTHGRSHMELGAVSNQNFVILGAAPPLFRPWHQTAYRAGIKELVTFSSICDFSSIIISFYTSYLCSISGPFFRGCWRLGPNYGRG